MIALPVFQRNIVKSGHHIIGKTCRNLIVKLGKTCYTTITSTQKGRWQYETQRDRRIDPMEVQRRTQAYLCKTPNEARCLPGTLEALRAEGVQIVIWDSPEIYSEYAPYSYVEDMKAFIDRVCQLNRVA